MNEADKALVIYVILLTISFLASFKYGAYMIQKTGLFLPQAVIAGAINMVFGILAIFGWILYSWGLNEFLFFSGLFIGAGILAVSEAILVTVCLLRRKRWMQAYNAHAKEKSGT